MKRATIVVGLLLIVFLGFYIGALYYVMHMPDRTDCPPVWQCNGPADTNHPRCCP